MAVPVRRSALRALRERDRGPPVSGRGKPVISDGTPCHAQTSPRGPCGERARQRYTACNRQTGKPRRAPSQDCESRAPFSWSRLGRAGAMNRNQFGTRMSGIRRIASIAAGALLAVSIGGAAHALTYTTGDYIAVFVKGNTDFYVDLGQNLSSLNNGGTFLLPTPAQSGDFASGAAGATFALYETNAPFSGTSPRGITITTDPSVDPTTFNNKASLITKVTPAQVALDN